MCNTLSSFAFLCFYNFKFMEVVNQLEEKPSLSELVTTYCDQGMSDYLVVYLRLLTSLELQKEADFYQNFLEGNRTVKEFCSQVSFSSVLWIIDMVVWVGGGQEGPCRFMKERNPGIFVISLYKCFVGRIHLNLPFKTGFKYWIFLFQCSKRIFSRLFPITHELLSSNFGLWGNS